MSYYKGKPLFVLEGAGTRCYGGIRKGVPIKEKNVSNEFLINFEVHYLFKVFQNIKFFQHQFFFYITPFKIKWLLPLDCFINSMVLRILLVINSLLVDMANIFCNLFCINSLIRVMFKQLCFLNKVVSEYHCSSNIGAPLMINAIQMFKILS